MSQTRRLAVILVADVAGYSRSMEVDEEGTLRRLKALRAEVIDPKIAGHYGRIVKTIGDGLLVEFASVVDALRCAVEVQSALAEHNAPLPPDRRIELRVGIHYSDIVFENGDIFGDGVNIAAQLEGWAEPGGICVSARVQEDAAGNLDLAFEEMAEQEFESIARPARVFRVGADRIAEAAKHIPRRHILIADDHPLMRSALAQAVARALPGVELLEAASLDQVFSVLRDQLPENAIDLVLLDLYMPGMSGFTGLFSIRAEFPAIPVVVISASEDPVTVSRALDYGASGFVPKSAPSEHLAEAIRTVFDGDLWFPEHAEPVGRAEDVALGARVATLTPQQLKVFAMLAEGRLNKQIAHEMQVTEATVKAHVTLILRKLGVGNRTQAVIAAGRLLVDPSPPVSGPVVAPAEAPGSTTRAAQQV